MGGWTSCLTWFAGRYGGESQSGEVGRIHPVVAEAVVHPPEGAALPLVHATHRTVVAVVVARGGASTVLVRKHLVGDGVEGEHPGQRHRALFGVLVCGAVLSRVLRGSRGGSGRGLQWQGFHGPDDASKLALL